MSNKSVLKRLLIDLEEYDRERKNRDAVAERLVKTIEAMEGIPYAVITAAREWQYKLEMEDYFDEGEFKSEFDELVPKVKEWAVDLIDVYG